MICLDSPSLIQEESAAMKKPAPTFADKLRHARGNRTQADIAKLLEVPYGTWSNWELGHQVPPPYTQSAILERIRNLKPEPVKA